MFSKLLAFKGKGFIGFNNKLALNYFNGVYPENNILFSTFNAKSNVSVTKNDILSVLKENNNMKYKFYYPFPDLYFPRTIFTDEILQEMPYGHHYSYFGKDRMLFFNEYYMFNKLQKNNCVDIFANCFLLEISNSGDLDKCIFAKNQYFVSKKYRVVTKILNTNNKNIVIKQGLTKEAEEHLNVLYEDSIQASDSRYIKYIKYHKEANGSLSMPYLTTKSMSSKLQEILYNYSHNITLSLDELKNIIVKQFSDLYDKFKKSSVLINSNDIYTDEFINYFGEEQLTEKKINCLKNTSLDLHTDHIYSNENGGYQVIDIDPMVFFYVPINYIMWSIIDGWVYGYIKNDKDLENSITTQYLLSKLHISEEESNIYKVWNSHLFKREEGISQLQFLKGKVYVPNFLNYSDIKKYSLVLDAKDKRELASEINYDYFFLTKETPIIIYGAAAIGYALKIIFDHFGYNLLGFIDKRSNEISEAHGLPVWGINNIPKINNLIIIIGIKNVFEQPEIANELVMHGQNNLIYKTIDSINGKELNQDWKNLDEFYDNLIELKGKNLNNEIFPKNIKFPQTHLISLFELKDYALIKNNDDEYIYANIPLSSIFTAQDSKNPGYIWAEKNIISLVPHISLYNYFYRGGKENIKFYIDFCSIGAKGSHVQITDGWKNNLINNRLVVVGEMRKKMEQDYDFFIKNAPEVEYNSTFNYFNLNGGRHRAALFVFENKDTMPLKIKKKDYQKYLNASILNKVNTEINKLQFLNNPIQHPFFLNLKTERPQYFQIVLRTILERLSQRKLVEKNKIAFDEIIFGLFASDHGELKRLLYRNRIQHRLLYIPSNFEKSLDNLCRYDNGYQTTDKYNTLFVDLTINNLDIYHFNLDNLSDLFIIVEKSTKLPKMNYTFMKKLDCYWMGKNIELYHFSNFNYDMHY